MRNYANILVGILLILVGAGYLGDMFGWFNFNLDFFELAKWWPFGLILAGLGVFLHPARRVGNPFTVICLLLTMALALYNFVDNGVDRVADQVEEETGISIFSDSTATERRPDLTLRQEFFVENNPMPQAILKFTGVASKIKLENTNSDLFRAVTYLPRNFNYQVASDKSGNETEIEFKPIEKTQRGGLGKLANPSITLGLNKTKQWQIDAEIGAASIEWDLRDYVLSKLKIQAGASQLKLKFGSLASRLEARIETGLADVDIELPKEVGCRIKSESALASKDFEGFRQVDVTTWETDNYAASAKKIELDLQAGLASIQVRRN